MRSRDADFCSSGHGFSRANQASERDRLQPLRVGPLNSSTAPHSRFDRRLLSFQRTSGISAPPCPERRRAYPACPEERREARRERCPFRGLCSIPLTPLQSAHSQNPPVTPSESALPNSLDLKSFRIRTSEKRPGEGRPNHRSRLSTSSRYGYRRVAATHLAERKGIHVTQRHQPSQWSGSLESLKSIHRPYPGRSRSHRQRQRAQKSYRPSPAERVGDPGRRHSRFRQPTQRL